MESMTSSRDVGLMLLSVELYGRSYHLFGSLLEENDCSGWASTSCLYLSQLAFLGLT